MSATRPSGTIGKPIRGILLPALLALFLFLPLANALSATVHIPEKYTKVSAGDRVYFEIEIKYPENPSRKDLRLTYTISKDGKRIAQSKVLKAVETQASFIDYLVVPDSAEEGAYELKVRIEDYGQLSGDIGATFQVASMGSELRFYFFLIVGLIAFLGAIILWEVYRLEKSWI